MHVNQNIAIYETSIIDPPICTLLSPTSIKAQRLSVCIALLSTLNLQNSNQRSGQYQL